MNEDRILRLAKPKKKGLLSLIFSRFFIILILLILQLAVYLAVFIWLSRYMSYFFVFTTAFTLVMVIYLFMSSIDFSGKLTWLLIITVLPFLGAFFLLYTRTNLGHRRLKEREQELIEKTKTAIPQSESVVQKLRTDGGDTEDLAIYLNRSGCFPVYENTKVTYFPSGEEKFSAMLEELERAKHFIFMEYFIIEEGYMWGKILEILIRKAAEGVDVRVMYDGMCEMSTLPADYWKLLEEHGIKAKPFSPIVPVMSTHYNYRDHRKILVIDGECAFNGGVNLADEYINLKKRFGHWKDAALMLKGEAVKSFTLMFLQMWNIDEDEEEFLPWIGEGSYRPENTCGFVMPYGDCPLDNEKAGEMVYIDMLNRAGDYIHIMTPYLILDGELEAALKFAAERGIDVKIILPGIPDKKGAYSLAKSHYRSLTESGVKIYEYTPGFVHAKVVVSDDEKAVVGTINMDYRSLYHHFECATYMYKTDCIGDIEKDFQDTLVKCRPVTEESIKNEKAGYKILGVLMKFIAPLI